MAMGTYNGHSGAKREQVQRYLNKRWAEGSMARPACCVACGQTEGALHAHHEDYDRPDEWVPLCITCHLMLHCRNRNRQAWDTYRHRIRMGWRSEPLDQRSGFVTLQRTILRGDWPVGVWQDEQRGPTYLDYGLIHP
jgi:hypothetical protein